MRAEDLGSGTAAANRQGDRGRPDGWRAGRAARGTVMNDYPGTGEPASGAGGPRDGEYGTVQMEEWSR